MLRGGGSCARRTPLRAMAGRALANQMRAKSLPGRLVPRSTVWRRMWGNARPTKMRAPRWPRDSTPIASNGRVRPCYPNAGGSAFRRRAPLHRAAGPATWPRSAALRHRAAANTPRAQCNPELADSHPRRWARDLAQIRRTAASRRWARDLAPIGRVAAPRRC